jgi:Protein of unknown function (DUF2975)
MDADVWQQRFFVWMDRAFWLIWLAFPALIWLFVAEIRSAPDRLAELAPEQKACLAELPQLATFSATGRAAFWIGFGAEALFYVVILALGHLVIHRCARGRVLFTEMVGVLQWIGITIAGWPVVDLVLANALGMVLKGTGDVPIFTPTYTLDVPVLGVGLVIITISMAFRQAVRLREDAELTI